MSKIKNRKKRITALWIAAAAVLLLASVIAVVYMIRNAAPDSPAEPSAPIKVENAEKVNINIGYGMYIVDAAKYTGIFMEDGSNDVVSGILMIVVKNTGESDIQYAQIEMPVGDSLACFTLTTLPAGESVVLLEQNRMEYVPDVRYTTAISKNAVLFSEPVSLRQDAVKIQGLNGVLNVTNVSGKDITSDIVIYFKNSADDMLYGGITYRVILSGGLKKDELRQLAAGHFSAEGSRIMFVTCG